MACNNCNLNKCGCKDSYLTTPPPCPDPALCPNPSPCSEVFDAQCVVYTGDDITCAPDIVVNQNDTIDIALQSIVDYFCAAGPTPPLKEIFYIDEVSDIDVSLAAPGNYTYYFPTNYDTLTYTNTSGVTKVYKVHASFDTESRPFTVNNTNIINQIDGALIKTVLAVDSVLYETEEVTLLSGNLFDGPLASDVINIATSTEKVTTTPGGNPIEFRFANGWIKKNNSIFYLVSLQDAETVSLKFQVKDINEPGWLNRAQLLVEEV